MGILGKRFLDQVKTFHSPHPVNFGAEYAPPPEIAAVACKLDGQTMTIGDAVDMFMAVAGENVVVTDPTTDYIGLEVKYNRPFHKKHLFALISFR